MSYGDPVPTALARVILPAGIGHISPGTPSAESGAEVAIKEVVVDPAVDHVDAFAGPGGAHEHPSRLDDQVAPLDQFDAEFVSEEGMFVIGGIVDAGCVKISATVGSTEAPNGVAHRSAR